MGSHSFLGKLFHWGFVLLYAYGIFKQINDLSQLEDQALLQFEVVFSVVFLILVLSRYFYMRRFETFLGAASEVHPLHKTMAKSVHLGMYACLILLPVSGLAIAGLYTQGYTNEEGILLSFVLGVHALAADLSYVLIAANVIAAVYSRLKGEGVWTSMVPVWSERNAAASHLAVKITRFESTSLQALSRWSASKKK